MTEDSYKYKENLNIGLILTRLNNKSAYYINSRNSHPPMSKLEDYEARRELREGFRQLARHTDKPQIILAPEVATPRSFLNELKTHSCALGSMCIFGVDYLLNYKNRTVKNEIIIVLPNRWPYKNFNRKTYQFSIFKSNAAPKEKKELEMRGWEFSSDTRLWLFDAGPYGSFGVANCYDFLDVEMHLLYRTKIQHLFVLSYNRDVSSFAHTAESLCRTLYCNVVICNTGHYGGSVCVAPYVKPYKRVIYKHEGRNLFATQVIRLPVKKIIEQQRGIKFHDELKDLPPGFKMWQNKVMNGVFGGEGNERERRETRESRLDIRY